MTTKNQKVIIRGLILIASVFIIAITLHTISIGLDLASISEENINVQSWRETSGTGAIAADNVYNHNQSIRQEIYNSPNPYTRWISTTNNFVQLAVGFTLLGLSCLSIYIWYIYINQKIRRHQRRVAQRRKNSLHRNRKTAFN